MTALEEAMWKSQDANGEITPGQPGQSDAVEAGAAAHTGPTVPGVTEPGLGFSAAEVADAALAQDESAYAARIATTHAAGIRKFVKDPRDLP